MKKNIVAYIYIYNKWVNIKYIIVASQIEFIVFKPKQMHFFACTYLVIIMIMYIFGQYNP